MAALLAMRAGRGLSTMPVDEAFREATLRRLERLKVAFPLAPPQRVKRALRPGEVEPTAPRGKPPIAFFEFLATELGVEYEIAAEPGDRLYNLMHEKGVALGWSQRVSVRALLLDITARVQARYERRGGKLVVTPLKR